jgi:predicted dehydrogenase
MAEIGVGLLGLAHGHVQAYCGRWRAEHPDIRLVAAWDHDAERVAKAVADHSVAPATSAADLLGRADIEAVVIGAETAYHADLVEAAAAAGKTIVIQKPLALNMAQADRIVAAVDRHGVRCTVAWQMRVDPQNQLMKQLVADGVIGRVLMVRRRHGLSTHVWGDWFTDSWHVQPELNRTMWADDAAHAVDFLLWLLGEPVSVTAELASLVSPKVPDDQGIAIYRYADGTIAEVCSSFTCVAAENTTEIIGEKGVIVQNYGDAPSCNAPRPDGAVGLKWYLHGDDQWQVADIRSPANHGERITGLAAPIAAFLAGERDAIATVAEGRAALRMTLACYDAAAAGRRIRLEEWAEGEGDTR